MGERGMQIKTDINVATWEKSEFPILCENCLGQGGFIRMIQEPFGGSCKICVRPFTIFKWKPGRGEGYKKTEICQTCSKIKNICQTCILDLEFGLPSQLRDAVLSEYEGKGIVPESEVGQEYFLNQQIVALNNGDDAWATRDNPNERLLRMARTVMKDREQPRIKIPVSSVTDTVLSDVSGKRPHSKAFSDGTTDDEAAVFSSLPLPPGITSSAQLKTSEKSSAPVFKPAHTVAAAVHKTSHISSSTTTPPSTAITSVTTTSVSGVVKPKPPKPSGPPPASAFKNNPVSM